MSDSGPHLPTFTWRRVSLIASSVILLFGSGALVGYGYSTNYYRGILDAIHIVRNKNTPYTFVQPLLGISLPSEVSSDEFASLMSTIRDVVSKQSPGTVSRYSVYIKDLTNSHWAGINDATTYSPASLLKVAAAIAAYKQEEDHPGFINSWTTYSNELSNINAAFSYAPPTELVVGRSYQISTLIQKMLSDSDNAAKDLLLSHINQSELDATYTDLNVPKPDDADTSSYTISAADYSRFFRILYNATYLSDNDSNTILRYLSEASFKDGLVAGVPSTITVAHKFGERVIANDNASVPEAVELHDCGIVYNPATPYFLCVMTEGKDETALAEIIATISQTVYKEMSRKQL